MVITGVIALQVWTTTDRYLRSPHSGATALIPAPVLERPFSAQNCGTGAWPIEGPASMEPGECALSIGRAPASSL